MDEKSLSDQLQENSTFEWVNRVFGLMAASLSVGILGALVFFANVNIQYGLEDWRTVNAFEVDEGHGIQRVTWNIENHDFNPRGYYHYPYLWFSIGIAALRLAESFGYHIDVRFIGAVFREISLIGGIAAAYFTYKLLLLLGTPATFALLGGVFLLTTPDFFYWAHMLHPDVPQAALILWAFLLVFAERGVGSVIKSALANGAAMSFKFGGIFSLPFCLLYDLWSEISKRFNNGQRVEWKKIIWRAVLGGAVAVGLFVATNPYAIINFSELVAGISFIKTTIGKPYMKPEPWNPFTWVNVITNNGGLYAEKFFAAGLIGLIVSWTVIFFRKGFRKTLRDTQVRREIVLFLYAINSLLIMTIAISWKNLRYAYHFYPVVIVLATLGIFRMCSVVRWIPKNFFAFIFACLFVFRAENAFTRMSFASNKPISVVMQAGKFIAEHYPKDTVIFFEDGSYVPDSFPNSSRGAGISEAVFTNQNPKVVVLYSAMSGRWCWKATGTKFNEMKFVGDPNLNDRARETYGIYTRLASPGSGWKVVFEDADLIVLEREN